MASGLAISLWIGFGGPKPPIPRLPQSVDGCPAVGNNMTAAVDEVSRALMTTVAPPVQQQPIEYFPLYRLSYMWYAPLGFCVTVLVAQVVSRSVTACRNRRGIPTHKIDEALLSPLFPKWFRSSKQLQEPVLLVIFSKKKCPEVLWCDIDYTLSHFTVECSKCSRFGQNAP